MKRKIVLGIVAIALVVTLVVTLIQELGRTQTTSSISTSTQSSFEESSTSCSTQNSGKLLLFNELGTFTVLGKYQSDSAYAMAEVYTPNASLFVSPFLWNMKSANGEANLTYIGHVLHVYINFTHFKKVNPSISVDGYPGIMYGQEDWFPFTGSTQVSPLLPLPLMVTKLPQFTSTLSYSLFLKKGVIDDFSYDIWLTQNPNTTYLEFPDVEVMIWLYHNETLSNYFIYEGQVQATLVVNGTPLEDNFSVYVIPHTGSANGWIGVYFLSEIQLEGNVTVPLSELIEGSFSFIQKVFPNITLEGYYLDAIQVGMEFNDVNGSVLAGYTLYNWVIK
ncbi:hypothetical protein DJ532_09570 [Sulfolobus sp. A20-N-F8]|nr:hypothetical protein DJ532_09570 [Sulfolobus sp. A20-N-F8]